jgi:hypothetical protein
VCGGIEGSDILDKPDASIFLPQSEDRAVEFDVRRLNDTKLQPLGHMFLRLFLVGIQNLELLDINWFVHFEGQFHVGACWSALGHIFKTDHVIIFQDDN